MSVTFRDLVTKELEITNIVPTNVPENMEVKILTKALNIKVRGPQVLIDLLTEDDVAFRVDFSNAELGTDTYKGSIIYLLDETSSVVGGVGSYTIDAEVTEKEETN